MDLEQIISLAQAGGTAMLLVAVVTLWQRLNAVQDAFTEYLKQSARYGDEAAQSVLRTPGNGIDA